MALRDGTAAQALIDVRDVWKQYGPVAVLKGVSITLAPGQIHALLGGNGAGKSTLMKAIAGLVVPNSGSIAIAGTLLDRPSAARAQRLGLYLVPQEAHIFGSQSVLENICMGLDKPAARLRGRVEALVAQLAVSLDLDAQAATLEIADRQIVEILRGLIREARALILDEPTSALTPHEVEALFARMRALAASGVGIFFISHKLREIREICHDISVLRDGAIVLSGPMSAHTDAEIVTAMTRVAAPVAVDLSTAPAAAPAPGSERRLEVERLSGEGFSEVSFSLAAGEIVGLAGVVGAGRTELAETIFGLRPTLSGAVRLGGAPLENRSPSVCIDRGLVYLPEDRQQFGLFLDAPLDWNASAYLMHKMPFFLRPRDEARRFERFRSAMGIKCESHLQPARRLSGGNQQKVLLAKCLAADPQVLILDEPTRGVDVAARNDIYALIRSLAAQGVAILLISSDFDEIVQLSDRVLVMAFGALEGELPRGASVDAIGGLAFGAREAADA
ncbi:autoinducer 2 ABC transporter ATP-binding protein LsrA [Arsenicitalea aurantiaca]|uniref:Autoinducer 2 import ATP-binding protein LsrA n=1 Tax=Arsenicitalea aurantiaca TaxID=1783274 RepID=A0A433X461_9HYPH|nr:autoinducer 2 ABC transporter ATP-binding protein LsrA [Arsenicitalea aurantiaca]RUT28856.1 autoinducer 2 ABC transporter ATP-binding protein LsrA [Arsenicitalea aurantiaca]